MYQKTNTNYKLTRNLSHNRNKQPINDNRLSCYFYLGKYTITNLHSMLC